jgi:hypothetical protein
MRLPRPQRLRRVSVRTLPGKLRIGEPLANNLAHDQSEAILVAQRIVFGGAIVVSENLFGHVAVKVERFHGNVGTAQRSLQKAPEVFYALRMDLARTYSSRWFTVSCTKSFSARLLYPTQLSV